MPPPLARGEGEIPLPAITGSSPPLPLSPSPSPALGLAARLRHKRRQQQQKLLIGLVFSVVLVAALIGIAWVLNDHAGPANPPAADTTGENGESHETASDKSAAPSEPKAKLRVLVDGLGTRSVPDNATARPKPANSKPAANGAISAAVGDLKVTVASARRVGPPAGDKSSAAGLLLITVEVKNFSGTKKVEFPGWAPRGLARGVGLTDNFDNPYQPKPLGRAAVPGEGPPMSIYPDGVGREVLAFEPPVPKIEFLWLELPAKVLGGHGPLRIKIPVEKITDEPAADAKAAEAKPHDKSPKKPARPRPGSEFGIPE